MQSLGGSASFARVMYPRSQLQEEFGRVWDMLAWLPNALQRGGLLAQAHRILSSAAVSCK